MRFKQILIGLLAVFALAAALPATAQQTEKLPPINVKQYKLKNGLTVLMHEDHSTPIVAVNMWFHVGSKNEAPGVSATYWPAAL